MQTKLTFCGGAGMVTGSNFLLEDGETKFLVDCGLAQGSADAEQQNWKNFPYDPKSIKALIVTHAHIDHIGRIPKLVRDGFRGTIISTGATKDMAEPLLEDAYQLMLEVAEHHNRPHLYEKGDIAQALALWQALPYHTPKELNGGFMLEFLDSAHILGSAMAKLSRGGRSIVLTGDLGGNSDLLPPRDSAKGCNYLLMESVYGDRTREPEDRQAELARVVNEAAKRGGTLLIPAFSTERTQDLLYELRGLIREGRTPKLPVYIDSPLAEKMTRAFLRNGECFKSEIAAQIQAGENIFSFEGVHFVESMEESRVVNHAQNPKIILAGSGMSTGGRVLGHEREILPDGSSTIVIVGYQSAGSIGRRILEGEKKIIIKGEAVPVRAKIEHIFGYSAHIDGPHLLEFAEDAAADAEKVFVVMGEPASAGFLAQRIRDFLGKDAVAPDAGQSALLNL